MSIYVGDDIKISLNIEGNKNKYQATISQYEGDTIVINLGTDVHVGDMVKVVDWSQVYPSYIGWVKSHAPNYVEQFAYGIYGVDASEIFGKNGRFKVVAKAPHDSILGKYLCLIQSTKTQSCFLVEQTGIRADYCLNNLICGGEIKIHLNDGDSFAAKIMNVSALYDVIKVVLNHSIISVGDTVRVIDWRQSYPYAVNWIQKNAPEHAIQYAYGIDGEKLCEPGSRFNVDFVRDDTCLIMFQEAGCYFLVNKKGLVKV